jgi:hypothetical protein
MEDRELETESSEPEKEEGVEEVATRSPSAASCTSRGDAVLPQRRAIRFEDGDEENPNNCKYCLCVIRCRM